jgi:16S rRNA processing protein RimM
MTSGSRLRIGVLTRTYGLHGGVRCALDSDAVPAAIAVPCECWIGFSESFLRPIRLERYELRTDDLICYFAGVNDREAAAGLADNALLLPAEAVSYKEPLSHPSLIGYEVRDEGGEALGVIGSIFRTPAHFIWLVESDGREWMVPAIDEFVREVRRDERVAVVRPIPGMVVEEPEDDDKGA